MKPNARWVQWTPIAFGSGIAAYFQAPSEPGLLAAWSGPVMAVALFAVVRGEGVRIGCFFLVVVTLGFAGAKTRTEWVRSAVLERSMSRADVRGTVARLEPRPGGGVRLTLGDLEIAGLSGTETPAFLRIRVLRPQSPLAPGDRVHVIARLSPPQGPALPGGYDFARTAWYWGLGATGFALTAPTLEAAPSPESEGFYQRTQRHVRETIETLRQEIGRRIGDAVPGELGALAAALITGERGGISDETNNAFRDSGLLHILSISGLHMVVMAGAVYSGIRAGLALVPALALTYPIRRWAAAAASIAAFFYLLLSGASVATVRAYLMIAIMLFAIMLDRPALAMRNVALSALLILALMPESLLDPGFQMSYACVVALVSAYDALRARRREREREPDDHGPFIHTLRRLAKHVLDIVLSTVIASLAVAPFAIYHFHKSQQYALLANLIAIPISNLIVMPAGLLTLIAMPVGLEALPLAFMSWGLDAMREAARWVASLPGAVMRVPAISDLSFGLMIGGGLWLTLWQRRWRVLGLVPLAGGFAVAPWHEVPALLVGEGGRLAAVRDDGGQLAVLGDRSGEFLLNQWLEADGDARAAKDARLKSLFVCDGAGCAVRVGDLGVVAVARHESALADDCQRADILISRVEVPKACRNPRFIVDGRTLYDTGPIALYLEPHRPRAETNEPMHPLRLRALTTQEWRGERPWVHVGGRPAAHSRPEARKGGARSLGHEPGAQEEARPSAPVSAPLGGDALEPEPGDPEP